LSKPFFNVLGLHWQVEALREVVSQVGAQKVLHEQQAEMWKQKYSAMEKLVDHLELLVSVQQQQLYPQHSTNAQSNANTGVVTRRQENNETVFKIYKGVKVFDFLKKFTPDRGSAPCNPQYQEQHPAKGPPSERHAPRN
jgi:deoxyribodipyrimidine photolyase